MQTVNWHLLQMRKSKRIGWYVSCFNAGGSESMKRRIDECASSVSSVMSACTYTCVQQVICHTVQLRSCLVLSSCTQWPTWYGTYLQLILVTSIIIHICRDDFNDKMRSTRKNNSWTNTISSIIRNTHSPKTEKTFVTAMTLLTYLCKFVGHLLRQSNDFIIINSITHRIYADQHANLQKAYCTFILKQG